MAGSTQIGFDLVSNASGLLQGFDQADKAAADYSNTINELNKQTDGMFTSAAAEVDDYTDSVKKGSKATDDMIKATKKGSESVNIVKQLRQEIKFYTSEAVKAGPGTKAWVDNLAKAGKLKDELNDINAAVQSLNGNLGENFARATGESLGLVKSGFEGVLGVQGLMSEKSEEFEKLILRLQSLNALSNVAKEFAGIGDKIEEIKLGFSPVIGLLKSGGAEIANSYTSVNETLVGFFKNFSGNAKEAFKNGNEFIKDFGKNAGSVAKNIGTGFVSFFSNFGTNMKTFAKSAKEGINTIGTAIKANPLGVILTVITLVIGAFVLLKDKVKPIADLFEFLGVLWDNAAAAVERLGQAIGIMATEAEKKAEATIKNTEKELSAIEKRYQREIMLLNAAGKDTKDKELEKSKAAASRIQETLKLLIEKQLKEGKLNDEELKQRIDLEEKIKDVVAESYAVQLKAGVEARKKQEEDLKKKQEEAKKALEERKKLEQDFANALLELSKKADAADLEGLQGKAKIERQKQLADQELAALKSALEKKGKELDRNFKFTSAQEEQFGKIQSEINRKYNQEILNDDIKLANERADQKIKELQGSKDVLDGKQKLFETEQQLREAEINLLQKPAGQSQEEFELQKQKAILEIKKNAALESLDIAIKESDVETAILIAQAEKEIAILNAKGDAKSIAEAERLAGTIDTIKKNGDAQKALLQTQTAVVINETGKQIADIDKQINSKGPVIDWAKILGVDEKQLPAIKNALSKLADAGLNAFQQIQDAREAELNRELEINQQKIDASSELIDQRESELDDLRSQLEEENQLREDGLANNTDQIRREIEAKKAQLESERAQKLQALEEEKRLQKEKEKLARQQALADSITQGSNILTAGSTLFAKGAFAGPVGIITSIATIAAMIGSFFALKAQLKAAGFKEGVIDLQGPGTETSDSIPAKLSKGESVMTAKETKDNLSLFKGIRTKNISMIESGIRDLIKNNGISLSSDITPSIKHTKQDIRSSEIKALLHTDNSGMENRLGSVEERIKDLVKATNRKTIVLPDGTQIINDGSNTKIIRSKQ